MKYFVCLFFYIFSFTLCFSQQSNKLSPAEFYKKIQETNVKNIVDVRTPDEYNEGHIDLADNINWNGEDFDDFINRYDKKTPMFIYCLSGGRSSNAAKKARSIGIKQVYELDGGMMAWRSENLPEYSPLGIVRNQMSRASYDSLYQNKTKKILVDVYADWCGPCKKMKPILDKLAVDFSSELEIVRINADKHPNLCKEIGVEGLPFFILYKNNAILWQRMGYIDASELRNLISK